MIPDFSERSTILVRHLRAGLTTCRKFLNCLCIDYGDFMKRITFFAIIALLTVACAPSTPASQTRAATPPLISSPPAVAPSPTSVPPTATPAPAVPPSPLFDTPWDDRTPFAAGLHPDRQSVLDGLPGASVYHLEMTIAPDLMHLTGSEAVRYTNTESESLAEIYFRLFPNILGGESTVSNLKVNGVPAETALSMENSALKVLLSQPLSPGDAVVITLDFAVTVPATEGRNYASFAYLDGILALPHVYPMIAVYDAGGWNVEVPPPYGDVVYADTSFYLAKITAPAGLTLVTSGVTVATKKTDATQTLTVAAGPMRDFYLAASDRYQKISRTVGETTLNSFAPPEVAANSEKALGYIADSLQFYNDFLGAYPFTELDLIATPTTAGGIEYPGAIVLALGLYGNGRDFFQIAAVHETAHQWFYSLVGNDQIDNPWLDESLVQYLTWRFYREQYGQSGDTQMEQLMYRYWDRANRAQTPIGQPVAAYDEANYGAIVYGRGPIFFRTLEDSMGTNPFDDFLRIYFQQYEWGIATPADLQSAAEDACGCDLSAEFKAWVNPDVNQ